MWAWSAFLRTVARFVPPWYPRDRLHSLLNSAVACLRKPPDTVGELGSAEICVSHMPSWKAKKAWETYARKSTTRTLKLIRQQYPPFFCDLVLRDYRL